MRFLEGLAVALLCGLAGDTDHLGDRRPRMALAASGGHDFGDGQLDLVAFADGFAEIVEDELGHGHSLCKFS